MAPGVTARVPAEAATAEAMETRTVGGAAALRLAPLDAPALLMEVEVVAEGAATATGRKAPGAKIPGAAADAPGGTRWLTR